MSGARPLNSWDMLKIIGLLFMFVDHVGAYFFIHEQWMRSVGRGAAPIFLFLGGYASSYRFSRRLLLLACVMLLSNILRGHYVQPLNILFNIMLCRAVFDWMDKRGKVVEKPFEWFVVLALFAVISNFLVQYGTLGLLFAVYGYMKRRPERYRESTHKRFLIATFLVHAGTFILFFDLTLANILLMVAVLSINYWLLTRFEIRALKTQNIPSWLVRVLSLSAHYSGEIYVAHLIVISWVTGYPL